MLGAFLMLAFLIAHSRLSDHHWPHRFAHIKAMITGWEEEEHETPKGSKAH